MESLIGKKFNRLTVLARVSKQGRLITYLCRCDCGNEKVLRGNNVKCGHTKSCGCLMATRIKQEFTRHGHARQRKHSGVYKTWHAMKQRCLDENHRTYANYGAKGV